MTIATTSICLKAASTPNIQLFVAERLTVSNAVLYRDDGNLDNNLRVGVMVVVSLFLVVSVLAFPNGELCN